MYGVLLALWEIVFPRYDLQKRLILIILRSKLGVFVNRKGKVIVALEMYRYSIGINFFDTLM